MEVKVGGDGAGEVMIGIGVYVDVVFIVVMADLEVSPPKTNCQLPSDQ